jgi:hypothetical protein
MPREKAPYDTVELERVKRNLSNILTMDVPTVSALAKRSQFEVRPLASVVQAASANLNQKWGAAVLAQLPPSSLGIDHNGMLRIKADASSMRYLSSKSNAEDGNHLVAARKELFIDLINKMDAKGRDAYREMLNWTDIDKCELFKNHESPLSSDTNFGHSLAILEHLFLGQTEIYDQHWRENEQLDDDVPIPPIVTQTSSFRAIEHLTGFIEGWLESADTLPSSVPESLLARVSANLSTNRVLLERASINACGLEAATMNGAFLTELNRFGVTEVPDEMFECPHEEGPKRLHRILSAWFGYGGKMIKPNSYFARPMTDSDIEIVLEWSGELQRRYILGRGRSTNSHIGPAAEEAAKALAEKSHGSPANLFIFATTMLGAFYEQTRAVREFTGHSSPKYAVFPDRGDSAKGMRITPPAHAEQILQQAYGQIFFCNKQAWALRPEGIKEYADAASIKRAHLEQFIFFATKGRTSRQLLALFQNLTRKSERPA